MFSWHFTLQTFFESSVAQVLTNAIPPCYRICMSTESRLFPRGSEHLGIRIDTVEKQMLEHWAASRRVTLAQLVRRILHDYIEENGWPVREGEK